MSSHFNSELLRIHYECEKNRLITEALQLTDDDDSTSLIDTCKIIEPPWPCDLSYHRQTHLLSSCQHCLRSKFHSSTCIVSPTGNNNSGA